MTEQPLTPTPPHPFRFAHSEDGRRHFLTVDVSDGWDDNQPPYTLGDPSTGLFYVWGGALSGFNVYATTRDGADDDSEGKAALMLTHRCGSENLVDSGAFLGDLQELALLHRGQGCKPTDLGLVLRDKIIGELQRQLSTSRREVGRLTDLLDQAHQALNDEMPHDGTPAEPPAPEYVPGYQAPTLVQCGAVQTLWTEGRGQHEGGTCNLEPDHPGPHAWSPDREPDARGPEPFTGDLPAGPRAVGVAMVDALHRLRLAGPEYVSDTAPVATSLLVPPLCGLPGPDGVTCTRTTGHLDRHASSDPGELVMW